MEQPTDYIEKTLNSSIAALNTVSKIQDTIDKLTDFPMIGSLLSSVVNRETDYRFLVCGSYLVFYRSKSDIVHIDRVLYGRRDYMAILFGDLPEESSL